MPIILAVGRCGNSELEFKDILFRRTSWTELCVQTRVEGGAGTGRGYLERRQVLEFSRKYGLIGKEYFR